MRHFTHLYFDKQLITRYIMNAFQKDILEGIPTILPEPKPYDPDINHAPKRKDILSAEEKVLAIKNVCGGIKLST